MFFPARVLHRYRRARPWPRASEIRRLVRTCVVLLVLSGPVQEVSGRRVHYRQTSNLKRERLRTVET